MIELTFEETREALLQTIGNHTGLPLGYLRGEIDCDMVEQRLAERIVGQQEARQRVVDILSGIGLRHERKRPIASLMLAGPTGVGKTELALTLANAFFGREDRLTRIDCSELSEAYTVSCLVGSAPGYVGFQQGGRLTEAVRSEPFQLVLFDEIEKAHRDLYPLLLQILDAGRLTDRAGLTVDFRHTLVVFTSNLGSSVEADNCGFRLGRDASPDPDRHLRAVREFFAPEFVGRLDAIIAFNSLSLVEVDRILRKLVSDLEHRVGVTFRCDDLTWRVLCHRATSIEEGARRARRVVEHDLCSGIVRLKAQPGDQVGVALDDEGNLAFAIER